MTHVRRTLLIAAGAATLLLSACGTETAGTASPGTATPEQSTTSRPTASASSTKSSAVSAPPVEGATKPGTTLKFGEKAVVPFTWGNKSGVIAVAVTAIEQGANADLVKFGEKAKGIVPFFIRLDVENVSGDDLTNVQVEVRGLGEDGRGTGVTLIGDIDKCDSASSKREFKTVGAKFQTCVLVGAREGSKVASAAYNKGDHYKDSPVLWKAS